MGKGTYWELSEEEIFRFILREDNGSAFGREARSGDKVCNILHSGTKKQSFMLLYVQ